MMRIVKPTPRRPAPSPVSTTKAVRGILFAWSVSMTKPYDDGRNKFVRAYCAHVARAETWEVTV